MLATFWEKAGRLKDNKTLADKNFRKKMRISYSHWSKRQDRNNWHKRGGIKDIEYKKKTHFKYKETLALPPCTAGDNSIIV